MLSNQKGGVGKSTHSTLASIHAAKRNKKVLLIDLDPQNNSSSTLLDGVSDSETITSADLFKSETDLNNLSIGKYKIAVIPASPDIELLPQLTDESINCQVTNATEANNLINHVRDQVLYNFVVNVTELKKQFDCIVIDTPPSFLGLPLTAALCVVSDLYLLVSPSKYSSDVVQKYLDKIQQIKPVNPNLHINGIVINKYNANSTVQKPILQQWQDNHGDLIKVVFPEASWIEDCGSTGRYVTEGANNETRRRIAKMTVEFFETVWGA